MPSVALHIGERVLRNGLTVLAVQNPGDRQPVVTGRLGGEHGIGEMPDNAAHWGGASSRWVN